MIRALLDANIYISYLWRREATSTIAQVIDAATERLYVPLLPEGLLQEMTEAIARKKSLSERIKSEDLRKLTLLLLDIGEQIETITENVPAATRYPKDTYLLTYAVVGRADYLVTGDLDLLVLEQVGQVQIITPAGFLALLTQRPSP